MTPLSLLLARPGLASTQLVRSLSSSVVRSLSSSHSREARQWRYHGSRDLVPPPQSHNTVMPDKTRLPMMPKSPGLYQSGSIRSPKGTKELWRMMGEERVHCDLQLRQFGIVALTGGMIFHRHFEVLRMSLGRYVGQSDAGLFGHYRVDAPYKPKTDHGFGKRMGGGKGGIEEYGTPVRAGRVILEVGGAAEWAEVRPWLSVMARKLPFHALAVSQEMVDKLREEERRLEEENRNPISFEWLVRNNIMNCQMQTSEYDKRWFGKFVYKDRKMNKKWQEIIGGYHASKRTS